MTKPVKIEKLKIYINENTKAILDYFQESMLKSSVKADILTQSTPQPRGGLSGMMLGSWETLSQGAHNSRWIELPGEEIALDDNVYEIFHKYRAHLNDILKKMGKEAEDVERGETASRFVLLHAIILRVLVCALRVKVDDADYGQKIINAFNSFVIALNKSQILMVGSKLSEFEIELASTQHRAWMDTLHSAIKAMKIMHLPKTAISQISAFLEGLKHAIAAHILVTAQYRFKDADISPGYIRNTLRDFERNVVLQEVDNWEVTELLPTQQRIIDSIKDTAAKTRISGLYTSFVQTNLLLTMSKHLDTMVNGVSWILILSNYTNIGELVKVVRLHVEDCNQHLPIEKKELTHYKKDIGYQQLVKYNLLGVSFTADYVCEPLNLLQLPSVRALFLKQMQEAMTQLSAVNEKIKAIFGCSIINEKYMDMELLIPRNGIKQDQLTQRSPLKVQDKKSDESSQLSEKKEKKKSKDKEKTEKHKKTKLEKFREKVTRTKQKIRRVKVSNLATTPSINPADYAPLKDDASDSEISAEGSDISMSASEEDISLSSSAISSSLSSSEEKEQPTAPSIIQQEKSQSPSPSITQQTLPSSPPLSGSPTRDGVFGSRPQGQISRMKLLSYLHDVKEEAESDKHNVYSYYKIAPGITKLRETFPKDWEALSETLSTEEIQQKFHTVVKILGAYTGDPYESFFKKAQIDFSGIFEPQQRFNNK